MIRILACSLTLAFTACATGSGAQTVAAVAEPLKAPIAALAGKIGINESYVTLAVNTAQALLGQGKDQGTAVKQGVEQAASKALADGKVMSTDQQASLAQGINGLLGAK
jgi:Na+-transporting NADH:ubiquinone oxidoreductase subunit NqrD